jgi:hypothetical protein
LILAYEFPFLISLNIKPIKINIMKLIKLNLDGFKRNELSKEKSKKITGGSNLQDNNEILILLTSIDPPKVEKPMGQV